MSHCVNQCMSLNRSLSISFCISPLYVSPCMSLGMNLNISFLLCPMPSHGGNTLEITHMLSSISNSLIHALFNLNINLCHWICNLNHTLSSYFDSVCNKL